MNILYLGSFPPDFLVKRSGGKIDSLYRDDQAIIRGLSMQDDVNLKVITSPDISSWPRGPLHVHYEVSTKERITLVDSLNLPLLKQPWTIVTMVKEASKFIRQCEGIVVVFIPYIFFRHVYTLRLLKRIHPQKVVPVCVVPDIYFPTNWLLKMINGLSEKMASKFDAFILYTQKMADHLHIAEGQYEVIEGFREVQEKKPKPSEDFNVVYAGSLDLRYGVGRLIEAMSYVEDKDVFLHLYGAGTAESFIQECSLNDKRIIFHGKVPNAEATEAIYSATVLINPRNAYDGEFTEYSFPSKDIEYLSTGIPTLLCKLPGMPKEYFGHFVDIGEGTPKQIATAISKVKQMTVKERVAIGKSARSFIIERMDCDKQAKRIIRLLEKVINIRQ